MGSHSFTIDWIAATFPSESSRKFTRKIGFNMWAKDVEAVPPRGYNVARELETGAIIAWHTDRKDMGVHVRLSGQTLRWYATKQATWHDILRWIKEAHGRTSRIDLALDVRDSTLTLTNLRKPNLHPYKGKGRTPKFLPMGTIEDGWTVYVGSRSSDKFLRIYDKAKEQGLDDENYVRIELETKGEIAHAVGWEFPEKTTDECVEMAQTLIRGVADFALVDWQAALSSRDVALSTPQGKDRDTFGWLIKICAPALAKTIAKKPNEDVMGEFWLALQRELRERGLDIE